MHNKIVLIAILLAALSGFSALSKTLKTNTDNEATQYKPYTFTDRDQAELVVTKFIRAIENGDFRTASLLIEKDAKYHTVTKTISEFYNKYYATKIKKYMILYPQKFIFNDSIVAMHFDIRNTIKPHEKREAMLSLVNKENQWVIKTSSSFFDALISLSTDKKKTGDTK